MAGNNIVTTTVNKVTWQVDQSAYGKALKQIKSLKKEWEKVGSGVQGKRNNPAAGFMTAAAQAKLVSKRLAQTERAEQAKTTAHSIAMAKKEANARATISKRESARRKQAVGRLTNTRTPESQSEYNKLKAHYQNLQKNPGSVVGGGDPNRLAKVIAAGVKNNSYVPSGLNHFGGSGTGSDPGLLARQTAAMNKTTVSPATPKSSPKTTGPSAIDKETELYRKALDRREAVVRNAQRRLQAQLGDGWAKQAKGFRALKDTFELSGKMGASEFNSQIGQMIRNAKMGSAETLSLSSSLGTLRSSLVGVTAAYSAFNGAASILASGQFFQSMNATMLMVSDSSEEAGRKMQYVQEQSYRLGLSLKVASQGYTQMAVNAKGVLSDSDTNSLFKGLSEFSTASGADPVKYQRGITAIGQMLGKGQVMAEELKGQLAEALPGSMQIFVKAAQKYFKDDKIGVPEFQKLMKDGKILSKDILPLVAEGFAEAARKGGALDMQLKSSRVAMERMRQSWMKFQNAIFQSQFETQTTALFNSLAAMLNSNGPLGKALGEFAGGFIKSMRTIIEWTYNTTILIGALFEKLFEKLGIQGADMGKIFNFAGMIIGALFFANALKNVFSILSKIAGLSGAIKMIGSVFGAGDDEEDEDGNKKKKKKNRGFTNKVKGFGKKAGIVGLIAGWSALLGDYVFDEAEKYSDSAYGTETTAGGNLKKNSIPGQGWDWLMGKRSETDQKRLDYLNANGLMPGSAGSAAAPVAAPPQKVEVEIKTTVNEGMLKDMIDQQIEMSTLDQINLITGVPN